MSTVVSDVRRISESFWRKNAAMQVYIANDRENNNKPKVIFKFMKSDGQGKYNESKDYFSMPTDELFKFILLVENYARNKNAKDVVLVHKTKDTKTLTFRRTDKGDFMLVLNKYDELNNKVAYYISFNTVDLKYFVYTLRKMLYFMETGSMVGFHMDWF